MGRDLTAAVDLSVVIPVYDEEATIGDVLDEWTTEIGSRGLAYELRVYDDGSRDATARILEELGRAHPPLVVIRQPNRGHGPTILRGYAEARGAWILQVDGDGEIAASHFGGLWAQRDADLVLGSRVGRAAPLGRRVITAMSRWSVRTLFGGHVRDVNSPYRLFRRDALARLLPAVPPDVFAPNVILTGLAVRAGMRVVETPVPHRGRRQGGGHLGSLGAWQAAAQALAQTVRVAWTRAGAGS